MKMLQILARIARNSSGPQQNIHHIYRSFSYKPVGRKSKAALINSILEGNRKTKVKKVENFTFSEFNLKSTDDGRSLKILESLTLDVQNPDKQQIVDVFERLSAGPISADALLHHNFGPLIDATKLILPKLNGAQNVQVFKCICQAEIPMFDELTENIVKSLLSQINSLTIEEITEVDFTLRKYYVREGKLSKLFAALCADSRSFFILRLRDELNTDLSTSKLMQITRYLSNNRTITESVDTELLSKQFLSKPDDEFSQNDAVCTIAMLGQFKKPAEGIDKLNYKMNRVFTSHATKIDQVKALLYLLVRKDRMELYNDPEFIRHCSKLAIEQGDTRSIFDTLKLLNKLNFGSKELIDHLSTLFNSERHKELFLGDYAAFCKACSVADYKPNNWEARIVRVMKHAGFQRIKRTISLDLALELNKLGIYNANLVEHIMRTEDVSNPIIFEDSRLFEVWRIYVLQSEKTKEENDVETNHRNYVTWLSSELEKFIGENKILNNVTVDEGYQVSIVMKVNTESGEFIDIHDSTLPKSLNCKDNEVIFGVITDINCETENIDDRMIEIDRQKELIRRHNWIPIVLPENPFKTMRMYQRAFTFYTIINTEIDNWDNPYL